MKGLNANAKNTAGFSASLAAALQGLPEILDVILSIDGIDMKPLVAHKSQMKPEVLAIIAKHTK